MDLIVRTELMPIGHRDHGLPGRARILPGTTTVFSSRQSLLRLGQSEPQMLINLVTRKEEKRFAVGQTTASLHGMGDGWR
jgi:hypothetical protein